MIKIFIDVELQNWNKVVVFDAAFILVLFSWKVITLLRRSFLGDQANAFDYAIDCENWDVVELIEEYGDLCGVPQSNFYDIEDDDIEDDQSDD